MLSFIIIGRNEEENLKRTFEAIYKAIVFCGIKHYEIIYVDSKSTDKSLEITRQFPEVRIFSITGSCNAAIGRNIGAKESKADALFFIDADMEISAEFLSGVWDNETNNIKNDFVSGQLIDIENGLLRKRSFNKVLPGGIFLIKREIWFAVNGMNTKFNAGEEYDLGLRLMKKGYRFVRKPEIITNHYTVPILNRSRIWKTMWSRYMFYPRCVLLRDHLFTGYMYVLLWKNDKTFILLVLSLITLLIHFKAGLVFLGIYFVSIILRVVAQRKYLPFFQLVMYFLLFDFLNLIYFFSFFPKKKREEYFENVNQGVMAR